MLHFSRLFAFFFIAPFLYGLDFYVWQAVKTVIQKWSPRTQNFVFNGYWGLFSVSLLFTLLLLLFPPASFSTKVRIWLFSFVVVFNFSKLFVVFTLLTDDLTRLIRWAASSFHRIEKAPVVPGAPVANPNPEPGNINRSVFLAQSGVLLAGLHTGALTWGIVSSAHDYRIREVALRLPNLSSSFDGMRVAQISDIHAGSFWNKTAVKGGVEMLLAQKPDLIFFTGDLVNNEASEMNDWFDVFSNVKAPLGVFSILGNHDYGDYKAWNSIEEKRQNLRRLIDAHTLMGWNILLDEHRTLRIDGAEIALLGVQNWGTGRFPKYGNLAKAHAGTAHYPVKLLLSHDPSHWDGEIRPQFPDITATFSGHTHGGQYGVEVGGYQFSPIQLRYKQWAGLYETDGQKLYVNRGYGYLGYPGRVGILPEITIFELKSI